MKHFIRVFAPILVLVLLCSGCKKDKDRENYLKYGDTKYDLSAGILYSFGAYSETVYYYGVMLASSTISIQEADGNYYPTGIGELIYLILLSSDSEDLGLDEYEWEDENYVAGTFPYGEVAIEYNLGTEEGLYTELSGGTVNVLSNGNTYEIEFNCLTPAGIVVEGYYKGSLFKNVMGNDIQAN